MTQLAQALASVDWKSNAANSLSHASTEARLSEAAQRIAIWAKQFENADEGNPALCFIREMQMAAQYSAALIGLCLFKASAATTRAFFETALYYTFFRTHHEELATLTRNQGYYESKADIISFHKIHTARFNTVQEKIGLLSGIETWYSNISAVVHGQVPGEWNSNTSIETISFNMDAQELSVAAFIGGEAIVHKLFLSTSGKQLWGSFNPDAKAFLLKGMPPDQIDVLKLDRK